jgi:alpha-tubulin suppressor-like RCC1 family protein
MRQRTLIQLMGLAALLGPINACTEGPDSLQSSVATPPRPNELLTLIVSGPVRGNAGSNPSSTGGGQSGDDRVFVSLPPGSVPEGTVAEIHNQRTDGSYLVAVINGGFDPVTVAGRVGDTLLVKVERSGGREPLEGWELVGPRIPIVIRTEPAPWKADVPLNSIMVMVFSEPIDPATLSASSIQLMQGATPVAGTVRLADDTGLRAELYPDDILSVRTEYRLVITPAIHDLDGVALAETVTIPFTTIAPPTGPLASISITPDTVTLVGNTRQQFTAVGRDAEGNVIPITPVWTVLAGGGYIDQSGLFIAGLVAGTFGNTVHASIGDITGYATVVVTVPALSSIEVTPNLATLKPYGTLQFTAIGTNEAGDTVPISPRWKVSGGGGTISSSGLFTAGPLPGLFTWTVEASVELVTGNASVWVTSESGAGLRFASVTVGDQHSCGLAVDGTVHCWGDNTRGALGTGTTSNSATPLAVAVARPFWMVSAGGAHTCATTPTPWVDNFTTYCWGGNGSGELADGTTVDRVTPQAIADPYGGAYAGAYIFSGQNHTCMLDHWAWGAQECWGANAHGQLGNGTTISSSRPVPIPIEWSMSTQFAVLSAGDSHTCGSVGGGWYCWGANANGQLGDGTTTDRLGPIPVGGGVRFLIDGVSAGGTHTCGIESSGSAFCWGDNGSGQLGDGTTTTRWFPTPVAGNLTFVALVAGGSHTCGITTAGTAWCWGDNSNGQLGDGSTTSRATPVPVAGGLAFAIPEPYPYALKLDAGRSHTCGVTTSGAVYCWGANANGQLGDGTTRDSPVPVRVAGQQ